MLIGILIGMLIGMLTEYRHFADDTPLSVDIDLLGKTIGDSKIVSLIESNLQIETKIVLRIIVRTSKKLGRVVTLDVGTGPMPFHVDSGTDVSVLSREMIPVGCTNDYRGKVRLSCVLGQSVLADLIRLSTTILSKS